MNALHYEFPYSLQDVHNSGTQGSVSIPIITCRLKGIYIDSMLGRLATVYTYKH
jgi:hypothetical protein